MARPKPYRELELELKQAHTMVHALINRRSLSTNVAAAIAALQNLLGQLQNTNDEDLTPVNGVLPVHTPTAQSVGLHLNEIDDELLRAEFKTWRDRQ